MHGRALCSVKGQRKEHDLCIVKHDRAFSADCAETHFSAISTTGAPPDPKHTQIAPKRHSKVTLTFKLHFFTQFTINNTSLI